jgi:hypothetical protein
MMVQRDQQEILAKQDLLDKMVIKEFKACVVHLEHQVTMDYKVQPAHQALKYMRVRKKNTKK